MNYSSVTSCPCSRCTFYPGTLPHTNSLVVGHANVEFTPVMAPLLVDSNIVCHYLLVLSCLPHILPL